MGPNVTFSQDSLRAAARAAGIEADPVYLETTPSTNSVAARLAREGAPEWTVVAAGHQTGGRGRLGRSWFGAPGRSLLASVVVRPGLPPEDGPLVSLLAAVEMARACADAAGVVVGCKWPNDLIAHDRKVGGVLAEAGVAAGSLEWVVVGTGVNVSLGPESFPEELRASATSLTIEGGRADPLALLADYLAGFRERLRPQAPTFAADVVSAYEKICLTLGREVRAVRTSGGEVVGRAVGLDGRGGLIVQTAEGRVSVAFGGAHHLGPGPGARGASRAAG